MNKKGQVLFIFIILIPIILCICALGIDTGLIIKEKIKLKGVIKTVLIESYDKKDDIDTEEKIKKLIKENDISIENINIEISDSLKIENDYYINSVFGKFIKLDKYHIKASYVAKKIEDKIIIEKE